MAKPVTLSFTPVAIPIWEFPSVRRSYPKEEWERGLDLARILDLGFTWVGRDIVGDNLGLIGLYPKVEEEAA